MRDRSTKKNRFWGIAAALLGMMILFYVAGQLWKQQVIEQAKTEDFFETQAVILDPGHGGEDGGAVGAGGTIEKDINLSIALKLRDLLVLQGYTVYMTRETDEMTCDEELEGISARKKSDMHNRLALMDAHPEAVVLSIHQNLFEQSKYSGAQMFYGKNHPQSEQLAQILQDSFRLQLQPENERQIKEGGKNLYLLWEAENPIVLLECGFLSNPEECEKLCSDDYQKKIALTIWNGLVEWQKNL